MRQWIAVIVVGMGISSGGMVLGSAHRTGASASDEQLVEKAMHADLAGDTAGRREILHEALKQHPQSEAVRWQAGYVRAADGAWRTIDEFSQLQESNPDLDVYRQKRQVLVDTLTGHMDLARWCMRNDLPLQERFHWLAVLQFDPRIKIARSRLKVGDYDGQLMGHQEVTDLKLQRREYHRNLEKWRPRIKHWLKDLQSSDTYRRLTATEAIRNVRDPAAIPALVRALHVAGDWRTERRYLKELGREQAEPVGSRDRRICSGNGTVGGYFTSVNHQLRWCEPTRLRRRSIQARSASEGRCGKAPRSRVGLVFGPRFRALLILPALPVVIDFITRFDPASPG